MGLLSDELRVQELAERILGATRTDLGFPVCATPQVWREDGEALEHMLEELRRLRVLSTGEPCGVSHCKGIFKSFGYSFCPDCGGRLEEN